MKAWTKEFEENLNSEKEREQKEGEEQEKLHLSSLLSEIQNQVGFILLPHHLFLKYFDIFMYLYFCKKMPFIFQISLSMIRVLKKEMINKKTVFKIFPPKKINYSFTFHYFHIQNNNVLNFFNLEGRISIQAC